MSDRLIFRWRVQFLTGCVCLVLCSLARAKGVFEPDVTPEEHRLMTMAMDETNTMVALEILQKGAVQDASPALDFVMGNLYFQADELESATLAYQKALSKMPTYRSAAVNLGRVYLLQDRPEETIALYQQMVTDGQADADVFTMLGHALLMCNYPVSAEMAYRQALLLRPESIDASFGLAKVLLQQHRFPEGLAFVNELLQHDPANGELWNLRAYANLSMEQYDDATRSIEMALRMNCTNAKMLATLADLNMNQGRPEDALRLYELVFKQESATGDQLLRALEGFLIIEDQAGAGRMIELVEDRQQVQSDYLNKQNRIKLLRLKARYAQQQGKIDQAIKQSNEVLQLDPLDGDTLLLLAELYEGTGQLEDAVMACERAARIQGFEAEALVKQAQIEVGRDRYAPAVTLLESAQTYRDQPHVARYLEQVRKLAN